MIRWAFFALVLLLPAVFVVAMRLYFRAKYRFRANAEQLDAARLFRCVGCRRIVSWDEGAADDMPDHCDDCWHAAHMGDS